MRANPWLAVCTVAGVLMVCAWIAWAIHVATARSAREGLGVLIVWPAIITAVAVISIPFVWAFRVMRSRANSARPEPEVEPESADAEVTETG